MKKIGYEGYGVGYEVGYEIGYEVGRPGGEKQVQSKRVYALHAIQGFKHVASMYSVCCGRLRLRAGCMVCRIEAFDGMHGLSGIPQCTRLAGWAGGPGQDLTPSEGGSA